MPVKLWQAIVSWFFLCYVITTVSNLFVAQETPEGSKLFQHNKKLLKHKYDFDKEFDPFVPNEPAGIDGGQSVLKKCERKPRKLLV